MKPRIAFIFVCFLMLSGFSVEQAPVGQPSEERKAQEALPQSHDSLWDMLAKCKVTFDKKKYVFTLDYTPEVKALEKKQITASGFILPLESTDTFSHFLLSKRTPTCPFCPPGKPNEIIEVFTKKPMDWDEGIVAITGTMKFTNNTEMGLFFQLKDAENTTHATAPKNKFMHFLHRYL
ncbi:MAG: DUF3299 domain-containing protein [Proteobacteria bacterium]|nr:DUF3299 domain-containing protein [Pseudomonadota bacterium]